MVTLRLLSVDCKFMKLARSFLLVTHWSLLLRQTRFFSFASHWSRTTSMGSSTLCTMSVAPIAPTMVGI